MLPKLIYLEQSKWTEAQLRTEMARRWQQVKDDPRYQIPKDKKNKK
jgi:hypothetical protein